MKMEKKPTLQLHMFYLIFPKGKHFEEWLKRVGYNADFIAKKAAGEGTLAHDLCEQYFIR